MQQRNNVFQKYYSEKLNIFFPRKYKWIKKNYV